VEKPTVKMTDTKQPKPYGKNDSHQTAK